MKIFVDFEVVVDIGVVDEVFLFYSSVWFFEVGLYNN